MTSSSPCCPPTSHPSLADDYTPQGTKITYKSVEFYAIGTAKSNGNAIVIFSDIWGWDSGRIRRYADYLADTVADYVVIPKLMIPTLDGGTDGDALAPGIDLSERGSEVWPWLAQFSYQFLSSKIDDVFDHLQAHELARIGLLGVCYGGYLACHSAVNYPNIVCGVIPHPSIHVEEALMGGNNAELAKKVQIPLLLMPAAEDPPCYLPGGEILDNLVANNPASRSVRFADMQHGWTTRGDLSDEKIARDNEEFIRLMTDYFNEHLVGRCGRRIV